MTISVHLTRFLFLTVLLLFSNPIFSLLIDFTLLTTLTVLHKMLIIPQNLTMFPKFPHHSPFSKPLFFLCYFPPQNQTVVFSLPSKHVHQYRKSEHATSWCWYEWFRSFWFKPTKNSPTTTTTTWSCK